MDLIDIISEPGFLKKNLKFPEGIELDMEKLVCTGQSFGGITTLSTAAKDERIKAVAVLDPWFLPYLDEPDPEFFISKTPVLCLRSESANFF